MPPDINQQHDSPTHRDEVRRLAEAVRAACVEAALQSYEDAQISGLCHEGAWEIAIGALRTLDLEPLLKAYDAPPAQTSS